MEITAFYPAIKLQVPVALDVTLKATVVDTMIRYYNRSKNWVATLEPIIPVEGTHEYGLPLPINTIALEVTSVHSKNTPFVSVPNHVYHSGGMSGSNPRPYTVTHDTLWFNNKPIVEDLVYVQATLAPTRYIEEIPDANFFRDEEAIVNGALALLYATPLQEWTNLSRASYHRKVFEELTMLAYKQRGQFERTRRPVAYGGL